MVKFKTIKNSYLMLKEKFWYKLKEESKEKYWSQILDEAIESFEKDPETILFE